MWSEIALLLTSLTTLGLLYILWHQKLPKLIRIFKLPFPFSYFSCEVILSVPSYELPPLFKSFNDLRPIIYANLMCLPKVFITNLDDLARVFRVETERQGNREVLAPWLGQILLTDGHTEFAERMPEDPNEGLLTEYSEIANRHAVALTRVIDAEIDMEPVSVIQKVYLCVLDIMCEAGMGVDVKIQSGGQPEYVRAVLALSRLVHRRQILSWLLRPCVFNLTPTGRNQNKLLKKVFAFSEKVIMSRIMEKEVYKRFGDASKLTRLRNNAGYVQNNAKALQWKRNTSYLDLLLKNDPIMSVKEAQEEINRFIFTSHDKTSSAVVWTLFELGHNPDVQELAYLEQRDIFQSSLGPASPDDLSKMTYLDRIIKETFRLYPSTPIISRRLKSAVKIRDYEIPAGTDIPIFVYYIHRDPELYPNPETFNPDRFLPDKTLDLRRESYTPLIFGPRYCFAEEFAVTKQKIILSHILRRFTFTSLDERKDLELMGDFIIRPKMDLKFSFKRRLRRATTTLT